MKNNICSLLCFLLLPVLALAQEVETPVLYINEIQVANFDQYFDNANCYGAWVEFYNPSSQAVSLGAFRLVDGANEYSLPTALGSVPAEGFKVLWFDHYYSEGNYGTGARRQIPFKLDVDGGTLSLVASDGAVVSSVSYPPCIARCSWACTTDGGDEWQWTGEPSPGSSNASSVFADFRLEEPVPSIDSKVFDKSFWVRVNIPRGYTLRYTLDGSAPTATNGETSTNGLFQIASTTVLRLCFLMDGFLPSPVVTRTYIYRNHDYYLPILSVVSNPQNFFDDRTGVFVKGTNGMSGNGQSSACNWNMDWERPVNMEYLVPQGDGDGITYSMVLNQEMDLEICGGFTRAYGGATVDGKTWEARSSFRLKTDAKYEGVNAIGYPVFPLKPYNKYRCWQVRNGGNDTYARIKDPAIQMMVLRSGFYVDCQDYQPAHVFLNGDYYGMLNIRESNNKHFAYSNYGISFDDMDQFDLSNAKYNQKVGDNAAWIQLQNLARKLAQTKLEETYRQICDLLDIDEYVNYMALDCYIGPSDWITNTNNVKGFRSRTDGKFHFVLFDLDSAFGISNMLQQLMTTSGGANVDDLFRNLMKYDPFRRQFMDAFCIVDGSVFEPSRCEEIVREIYQNINPALAFEGSSSNTNLIGTIRSAHNGTRISNLKEYYETSYSLFADISSNISEARLSVNGQEIPTGRFEGYLFSYKGQPIQLTAKAPAGYAFSGWETGTDQTVTSTLLPEGSAWMYYDSGSMDGYNWQDSSFDENGWRTGTAPFGFANDGYYMQENAVTKLNKGTGDRPSTYYFRNRFRLDAPLTDDDVLTFNYQIDDGMMLYVNGHEVGGYYVASGSTYSDYTIGGHFESQNPYQGNFEIPHEYLIVGENQIAAEVKNCHNTSSDIWFDGSLTLTSKDRQLASPAESFDLCETYPSDSRIKLTARFTPITDEQLRQEAGINPLRINEVYAYGDVCINDYGKKADWIELYNTTDQDISLAGLFLSDDPSNPRKYQLQEGVVPAHGTQIIWCDKKEGISQLHAPFKLENADAESVCIQAADGSWTDQLDYRKHGKFQTFGRYPDGSNQVAILGQPTINKSNRLGLSDLLNLTSEDWVTPDGIIDIPVEPDAWDEEQSASSGDARVKDIIYYNLSGQVIGRKSSGSNLPHGICIRKVIYEDGSEEVKKMSH